MSNFQSISGGVPARPWVNSTIFAVFFTSEMDNMDDNVELAAKLTFDPSLHVCFISTIALFAVKHECSHA